MSGTDKVIENPVTGTRVVFRRTADDTMGRMLVFEMFLQPGGHGFSTHVHPRQEERLDVLHGTVQVRVGRRRRLVGAGGRITILADTPHGVWNTGDDVAHLVCELRPALRFEALLETMFALAAVGKTDRHGRPNLLRRAVIAHAHFDTVRLAFPPAPVQQVVFMVGSCFGRLLGYAPPVSPTD